MAVFSGLAYRISALIGYDHSPWYVTLLCCAYVTIAMTLNAIVECEIPLFRIPISKLLV